jgi:hypothetical protein
MFDRTNRGQYSFMREHRCTRRQAVRTTALALAGIYSADALSGQTAADPDLCKGDVAIDKQMAQIYSLEAPLVPGNGLRDARAVWCRVPEHPDKRVLIYFHGHNGYVTVDAKGRSRVPDWAAGNAAADAGARAKEAAPIVYRLDRLGRETGRAPLVMVPEVSTLATGSFWAKEPAGQYAEPARLGLLVTDCRKHLACLHKPNGSPYLADENANREATKPGRALPPALDRVYLCGHSGAGLPLEEAAGSSLISPETGAAADLWLFDCTYWSRVDGFVKFCERWKRAGRLAAGRHDSARFVCIYRPKTQTEEVADTLRGEIAKVIGVDPSSLVRDHSSENFDKDIQPALGASGALFVRTYLPHDEIPTFFIPALLTSAAT